MHIGKLIKKYREQQGLSMNELARRADVAQSGLSDVEAGKRQPTFDWLERVVNALNLTMVEFFSEEPPELPVHIRRLLASVQNLTPDQADALNQFIQSMTKDNTFDIDAHNEEARRIFRQALADEPELLNFWLEQEDRENLQLFMSQAKTLEPEDIKDIVRKIKQVEDEEAEY